MEGRGRGRGRGLTLPAWMTNKNGPQAKPAAATPSVPTATGEPTLGSQSNVTSTLSNPPASQTADAPIKPTPTTIPGMSASATSAFRPNPSSGASPARPTTSSGAASRPPMAPSSSMLSSSVAGGASVLPPPGGSSLLPSGGAGGSSVLPTPGFPPTSSAGYTPPPTTGYTPPPNLGYTPPPNAAGYTPPPNAAMYNAPNIGYTPPPTMGYTPPPRFPRPMMPMMPPGAYGQPFPMAAQNFGAPMYYGAPTGPAAAAAAAANPYMAGPQPVTAQTAAELADWSEHVDAAGRSYYYNKRKHISTYDKPDCMKSTAANTQAECPWKEFTDPNGRKYYHNTMTKLSVWEEPEELRIYKARQAVAQMVAQQQTTSNGVSDKPAGDSSADTDENGAPQGQEEMDQDTNDQKEPDTPDAAPEKAEEPVKMPSAGKVNVTPAVPKAAPEKKAVEYTSKEEATQAFKALLADKAISSTIKWQQAMPLIVNDERFGALRTLGEKKQAFAEYQNQKSKQEKEEKRQRAKKARENFMKMLAACDKITAHTRWKEATELLGEDPRFSAVEDSYEREELFRDFVSELSRSEREHRRKKREEGMAAFSSLLSELKEKITVKTRMKDIEEWAGEDERFLKAEKADRQHCLDDVIRELEKQEMELRRQEREEQRRQEAEKKEAFSALLLRKVAEEAITPATRWKDFEPSLLEEEEYKALLPFPNAARSTFERVVDELRESFKKSRRYIVDIMTGQKVEVTYETSYEEFVAKLKEAEKEKEEKVGERAEGEKADAFNLGQILEKNEKHVRLVFQDFSEVAQARKKEEERRKKRKEEDFVDLLMDYYYRSDHVNIPWEEARRELKHRSAYKAMDEEDCHRVFEEYMEDLRKKIRKLKGKQEKEESPPVSPAKDKAESTEEVKPEGPADPKEQEQQKREEGEETEKPKAEAAEVKEKLEEGEERERRPRSPSSSRSRSRSRSRSKSRKRDRSRSRSRERGGRRRKGRSRSRSDSVSSRSGSSEDEKRASKKKKKHDKDKKKKKRKKQSSGNSRKRRHRDESEDDRSSGDESRDGGKKRRR